ncbi:myosin-like protein [Trema orientale]|uniref:Myosin-like protein n=1 Tax=Trema orientale TaxID=63057 RepID=A0A2P5EUD1_TREOI|nr:myosin-like protein [Trema orientale]
MSITIGAIAASRRPKWQYPPPPPTPRILHLPRRPRRRTPKTVAGKPSSSEARKDRRGKLESLFDQERAFTRASVPIVLLGHAGEEGERRRERVEEREVNGGGGGMELEEEKWRFQAEMLRAECNLLRMEKEIAVKKLERTRVKMERTLRSAIHALVSERKKMCEGNCAKVKLEEEIQQLAEKLEKFRRNLEVKNFKTRKYHNFDKQAALLQRQLKIFRGTSDEVCVKKIQEMAEVSLSIQSKSRVSESLVSSDNSNVEILRKKMEGLSNGTLLERMKEECGSMLSTANSSETVSYEENNVCSGRCKAIVRRIMEQVRAETEQWSQMQEMLGQVREEMEELQASRDFWEDRALDYDYQMQSLNSSVQEWRQKAISSESKANQLEAQMYFFRKELERSRKEEDKTEGARAKGSPLTAMDGQHEMEKRVLICRLKENHQLRHANESCTKQKEASSDGRRRKSERWSNNGLVALERSPLRDIGNSCVSLKQHSKAVFPLVPSTTSKN